MADLFVSYASGDRERVLPLVHLLEEEGWSVWWDRELIAGPGFAEEIEEHLQTPRCVVVVWSNNSIRSNWCLDEASEGMARRCLVPVCIDDARPPLGFRSLHTATLTGWPPDSHDQAVFVNGVRACLEGKARTPRAPMPDSVPNTQPPDPNEPSIAVLPFDHREDDPDQAFLSDGLVDDIITELTQIPQLLVIARNTVFSLRDTKADLPSIVRQLDVRYVLHGNVRRAGDHVRVSAHLDEASTGRTLWSQRFDRTIDDIFEMQDELTREIVVTALDVELVSGESARTQRSKVRSPEAVATLYRGNYKHLKFERRASRAARAHFETFIRLEPDSSLGYAYLAQHWYFCGHVGWEPADVAFLKSKEYTDKALTIDPEEPRALVAQTMYLAISGDLDGALVAADKAVAVLPKYDEAWWIRGWAQMLLGETAAAIQSIEYAQRLCPILQSIQLGILATAYRNAGRYDDAIRVSLLNLRQNPEFIFANVGLAVIHGLAGDDEAAAEEVRKVLEAAPDYTVKRFTTPDFYRDPSVMERCAEVLRRVGMPEG